MALTSDEKQFFVRLGGRIAEFRQSQGITQTQLAEQLGISQQTVNSYEVGRRRVPASSLLTLARTLGVSLEELVGEPPANVQRRGPRPKLQQQMERIQRLPKAQQRLVMQSLEALLKGTEIG